MLLNSMQALTQALHAEQSSRVQQAPPAPAQPAAPRFRKRMEAKHMRLQEFDGAPEKWADWSFSFKRTVRSMDAEAYKLMTDVETVGRDVNEMEDLNGEQDQISGELYDILCQACTGEALSIIRSVDDCQGIQACQRLHNK